MLKRDSKGRFLAKYRYIYLIKYEVKFSNGKVRYDREYDKTVKKIMTTKNAKPIFVLPKFGKIKTKNNSTWFLLMPPKSKNGTQKYEQRFSIEKCFQDQKSSGFNIEKCKIRKYDRFKRLYFSMCVAQLLVVITGEYVEETGHPLKKTFPITAALISVFSDLASDCSVIVSQKQKDCC